jgi:hypothetical protein
MADEAFALSPISARAALPSEADYDAIREAFMETSRGRWFLGEYAKRNRNADTSMVLDAVARIEEALAAERHEPPDNRLADALAAIRSAVEQAEAAASTAFDHLALEENLAPIRKGARIIKEISWRWREIGADGRICDLLDSQVGAIKAGCGRISEIDRYAALSAAFDLIKSQIDAFDEGDAAAAFPADEEAMAAASPGPSNEMRATAEAAQSLTVDNDEAATITAEIGSEATAAADIPDAGAADAYDEAMLEMVALEMAAPDPIDSEASAETDAAEVQVAAPLSRQTEAVAERAKSVIAAIAPPAPQVVRTSLAVEAPSQPSSSPQPSLEPSVGSTLSSAPNPTLNSTLGSTLIASGIIARARPPISDPLAPIRRMSQVEKIAFFS